MKKIIMFLSCIFLLVGCGKNGDDNLIDKLDKRVQNAKNYQLTAKLEIYRNEDKFIYDIVSTYKKGDYFKVELTNTTNNHQQIILKNEESVYVLTPSLNKSFKFQSEWPYNNSQIYLLQPILLDIKNDQKTNIEKNDNGYIVISNVNYSSEKEFKKQKVYFDQEENITKVEIIDNNENVKMRLEILDLRFNTKIEDDFFDVNKYQKNIDSSESINDKETNSNTERDDKTIKNLNEVVYPMYVPTDTYLLSQDIVSTEFGERVILTFNGDSQFTLIQENLSPTENLGYVYGDPYLILDTVGAMTDYSLSWISNDVEYSVISDTMSIDELLTVAQSVSVETVGK